MGTLLEEKKKEFMSSANGNDYLKSNGNSYGTVSYATGVTNTNDVAYGINKRYTTDKTTVKVYSGFNESDVLSAALAAQKAYKDSGSTLPFDKWVLKNQEDAKKAALYEKGKAILNSPVGQDLWSKAKAKLGIGPDGGSGVTPPLPTPEPQGMSTGTIIAIVAGSVVFLGVVGYFAFRSKK